MSSRIRQCSHLQKLIEVGTEQPAVGVKSLLKALENINAVTNGFLGLTRCQPWGLIEKRPASTLNGEFVEGIKELVPAWVSGGHWINSDYLALAGVREKIVCVLVYEVADARHVASYSRVFGRALDSRRNRPSEPQCSFQLGRPRG